MFRRGNCPGCENVRYKQAWQLIGAARTYRVARQRWQPQGSFDLIIMFRFVASSLLPVLFEHLTPGGQLLVEEHMQWSGSRDTQRSVKSCFSGNINGVKTGAVALHRATGGCGGVCRNR